MRDDRGLPRLSGLDVHRLARPLVPLSPLKVGLLVLAILLITVLAAAGARSTGEPSLGPAPAATSAAIIRAFAILLVLAEVALFALLFFVRAPRTGGTVQSRRRPFLTVMVAAVQLVAAVLVFQLYRQNLGRISALPAGAGIPARADIPRPTAGLAQGQEWLTALIVIGVLLLAALIVLRHLRARRARSSLREVADRLRAVVDEGLEGLEGEPDPRRAVIAAYARMEVALARVGLPREPPEASLEYLARLLRLIGNDSIAARRLTELFHLAKYSRHHIDEEMKADAMAALRKIRSDLEGWAAAAVAAVPGLMARR